MQPGKQSKPQKQVTPWDVFFETEWDPFEVVISSRVLNVITLISAVFGKNGRRHTKTIIRAKTRRLFYTVVLTNKYARLSKISARLENAMIFQQKS